MKSCTLLLLSCLLFLTFSYSQSIKSSDSTSFCIFLNNQANQQYPIDSVFVIFDKYDRTGAGIIKKIYYPTNNQIITDKIANGRYYVDLYCLGNFSQHFYKIIKVKSKAKNKVSFRLKEQVLYEPGTAYIPKQKVNLLHLSITEKEKRKRVLMQYSSSGVYRWSVIK